MNQKLAELYGTNVPDDTDVEKLAAAQLAESLTSEEGVDLSSMTPEQIEALAQEVLGSEEPVAEGSEAEAVKEPEVAQEKVAEADYLGRVMAHAYNQELRNIEKKAAKMPPMMAKKHEKKAAAEETAESMSALDTLAVARAQEWMKEQGIETEKAPESEKTSSALSEDQLKVLGEAVDSRAYAMLVEAGYIKPEDK